MKKYLIALVAAAFLVGISSVRAQDQPGPANDQATQSADPNAPGMARVSFVHGSVSTQRGDNGDWVPAIVNTPVAVGDRVSTGPDGRAGLQLDYADILRMSSSATAKIAQLDRNNIQVQIGQGLTTYTVLKDGQATPEIDTPNAALHPNGPGEYRILVNSDAETEIVVRSGSAEVSTPQGSTNVDSGQMITVAGTDNPEYKTSPAPAPDEWDAWNNDRNQKIETAQSWRKTDPYYTGSSDLDGYGVWSEVPDYGPVWIPSEAPGWAPYRAGRWVYEPYYGWTWVSYEPWGWAPYHYGRWLVWGGSWVWWPGPVVYNPFYYPVWAPAYVSFFGWGGGGWGVSVGVGFGGFGRVGWLPCGPGDWYRPWYGRWGRDYRYVDVHEGFRDGRFHDGFSPLDHGRHAFSNFNEAFRNDRVRAGFSSMEGRNFGHQAVSMRQERISASRFGQARLVGGRMPFNPTRASYSPTGRGADPRSFRSAPPASQHFFHPVTRANTGIERNAGSFARAHSPADSRNGFRPMNSNRNGARGPVNSSRPGWRTFNPQRSGAENRPRQGFQENRNSGPNRGSVQSARPGWHTFTPPQSGNTRSANHGFRGNQGPYNNANRRSYGNQPPRSAHQPGAGNTNRGNWQRFTPQPPDTRSYGPNRNYGQPGAYQQRAYGRQADPYRGGYSNNRSNRPPLNMHQPIVRPRGNYRAPRSYNQPRGNSGSPHGGYNAPRGGQRGGYHGGGSRGGGGGDHGGGGHGGGGGRGGHGR